MEGWDSDAELFITQFRTAEKRDEEGSKDAFLTRFNAFLVRFC